MTGIGATERERQEQLIALRTEMFALGGLGRGEEALALAVKFGQRLSDDAPDDTLCHYELGVYAAWVLYQLHDFHAAERNCLLALAYVRPTIDGYEEALRRTGVALPPGAPPSEDLHSDEAERLARARFIVGTAANTLGALYTYSESGSESEARSYLELALQMRSGRPELSFLWAQTLTNLTAIERRIGEAQAALEHCDEALALMATIPGIEHVPDLGYLHAARGEALVDLGRRVEGHDELYRALAHHESLTPHGPGSADMLSRLGSALLSCGCRGEAEIYLRQAFSLRKGLPDWRMEQARDAARLGATLWARGELDEAIRLTSFATLNIDLHLMHTLEMSLEEERLNLVTLSSSTETLFLLLSMAYTTSGGVPADDLHDVLLRRKGLGGDITGHERRVHGANRISAAREHLAEIEQLRARLTAALTTGASADGVHQLIGQLRDLEQSFGWVERMGLFDAEAGAGPAPDKSWYRRVCETGQHIRPLIGPRTALIDFVAFPLFPPTPELEVDVAADLYYAAFVFTGRDHVTRFVRLGPAAVADKLIDSLLQELERDAEALASGSEPDFLRSPSGRLAEQVRIAVLDRVLSELVDVDRLLICPDGALARLSFAMLPHDGGYLGQSFEIASLASARDLLAARRDGLGPPVVLADPDFDAGESESAAPGPADEGFERLGGTREEGIQVAALLGASPLLDRAANEQALRSAAAPSILHIASHGWYLEEQGGAAATPEWAEHPRLHALTHGGPRTWGVRSGLVLAGFNAAWSGVTLPAELGDGLLTADEVLSLDVAGTELIVLSGCDTGLGQSAVPLEGVYGLRRAFLLAGAQSVIVAQWQVPDGPTRLLMSTMYRQLRAGAGRAEALRMAQDGVRAQYPHPHAWAGFVLYGLSGPLSEVTLTALRAASGAAGSADLLADRRAVALARLGNGDTAGAWADLRDVADAGDSTSALLCAWSGLAAGIDEEPRDSEDGADPSQWLIRAGLAEKRGQREETERIVREAYERGADGAASELGTVLHRDGKTTLALEIWLSGAQAGDAACQYAAGCELDADGDTDAAVIWWQAAAAGGDVRAATRLRSRATQLGDETQAQQWCTRAAELGDPECSRLRGISAYSAGDLEGALQLTRVAADGGDVLGMHNLAHILDELGLPGADGWFRRAALGGYPPSANRLAILLEQRGDVAGSMKFLRIATDNGHPDAQVSLGLHLCRQGADNEAEQLLAPRAAQGDVRACAGLGEILIRRGDVRRGETLLAQAAAAGDPRAHYVLARQASKRGDQQAAQDYLRTAALGGVPMAMVEVGSEAWLTAAQAPVRAGSTDAEDVTAATSACLALALMRYREADRAGAIETLKKAPPPVWPSARRLLAAMTGDPERLAQLAAAGHIHAATDLVTRAVLNDDTETAYRWAAVAARGGDPEMIEMAARSAGQPGRRDEVQQTLAELAERGSAAAAGHLARMYESQRQARRKAAALRRRAEMLAEVGYELEAGQSAYTAGDLNRAAEHLKRGAKRGSPQAAMALVMLLLRLGRPDEARAWADRAGVAAEPEVANSIGLVLFDQGKPGQSRPWLMTARSGARGR